MTGCWFSRHFSLALRFSSIVARSSSGTTLSEPGGGALAFVPDLANLDPQGPQNTAATE